MAYEVALEDLRRWIRLDPKDLSAPKMPIDFVGQERAQSALALALSSQESKFHALVVAENLPLEMVAAYVRSQIETRKAEKGEQFDLHDYCYVYNFNDPAKPALLTFPARQGKAFKRQVQEIRESLRAKIPTATEALRLSRLNLWRKHMQKAVMEAELVYENIKQRVLLPTLQGTKLDVRLFQNFDEEAKKVNFGLNVCVISQVPKAANYDTEENEEKPIFEHEAITQFIAQLPEEERKRHEAALKRLQSDIQIAARELQAVYNRYTQLYNQEEAKLLNSTYTEIINKIVFKVMEPYSANSGAINFLVGLHKYVGNAIDLFTPQYAQTGATPWMPAQTVEIPFEDVRERMNQEKGFDPLLPFEVNLFVDNSATEAPPIVLEDSPTYTGLFGVVEKSLILGKKAQTHTDHTKIKAGAMHRANGGFLLLNLTDIVETKLYVFLALKRTLRENKLKIQDAPEETGLSVDASPLFPEPANMELKIIAVVKPELYFQLWHAGFTSDLMASFKITAMLDDTVEITDQTAGSYAAWMENYATGKGFPPLTVGAAEEILQHLCRLARDNTRLAADAEKIKTVIQEAYFYAKETDGISITSENVRKAIAEKRKRSDLLEEHALAAIEDGEILIATDGEKVGQINGLSVLSADDYAFGLPIRVTVSTYRGAKGLINIQKEAGLSGPTTTMGLGILQGYFYERYGQERMLGFEGRVVFEQAYGKMDGPSATTAQLFALLSSLSGKPIKQSLAITGTVDQKGNIGAIGGANEKIEGFFRVCEARGLTGKQGVIIPKSNIRELMLDPEIVKAVTAGMFTIYAIETVAEGIELLTGQSLKDIDKLVRERLKAKDKPNRIKFSLKNILRTLKSRF